MKPLKKMLCSELGLASIEAKLTEQEALIKRIRSLLPQPMGEHCIWAIFKKGDLILLVDSPAWASRVRYLSPKLSQELRQTGLRVRRTQVKVTIRNKLDTQRGKTRKVKPISPSNAKILSSIAESVNDDGLRTALLRLSRHGLE